MRAVTDNEQRRRLVLVSTGGTIAMQPDRQSGKLVPAMSASALVESDRPEVPVLELDDFANVPSFDMHGELAFSLARHVVRYASRGIGAIVSAEQRLQ